MCIAIYDQLTNIRTINNGLYNFYSADFSQFPITLEIMRTQLEKFLFEFAFVMDMCVVLVSTTLLLLLLLLLLAAKECNDTFNKRMLTTAALGRGLTAEKILGALH
ncbi:hypothetical protein GQX74_013032 [Glossina fuscipes]|nr:hypothetical protein GQX74_013032 [Glossina fuscipes]